MVWMCPVGPYRPSANFFVISPKPSDGVPAGTVLHGTGIYQDEFVKIDGTWMIAKTGFAHIFEDIQPRAAGSRLRAR